MLYITYSKGNIMKPELRNAIRISESVLLGVGSLVSPNIVRAESSAKLLSTNDPVFLQGDGGNNNHLKVLLIGQNGTTLPMLEEVKDDLFSISPMDEFRSIMDVAGILGGNELGCNQKDSCDWGKINEVINGYLARGLVFHETMVVIRKSDEGGTGYTPILPSHLSKPNIYSPSAIVRPADTRVFREGYAGTVVHEFLHQFAGFDHEGNDIMQRICNCINAQHARFLRGMIPLVPRNYDIPPQLEFKPIETSTVLSATQTYQLSDMGFAFAVQSPADTTQLYAELRPYNNDGAGVFDYAGTSLAIQAWRDAGRRIPAPPQWYGLLPDMTYTWKVRVSNLAVPLAANDPRWEQTEAWPGIFLPNSPAEIKVKTPKRFSDGIGLVTLAGGQETNNLNPTLVWNNRNSDVFYYEVQVSKDPNFSQEPGAPFLYWELRHGGVTNPKNSYTIPPASSLEKNTGYFWRVRPRIQGDGTPVAWNNAGSFKTSPDARVLSQGELEVITQAEKAISVEEHLKLQKETRKAEQERMRPTREHWQWVEKEVQTKTEIPLFNDNGKVTSWIDHSDNISFEAYRKEEELQPAA